MYFTVMNNNLKQPHPEYKSDKCEVSGRYFVLYSNQINVRALIGQSAVGYCAGKPTEKSRVF